MPCRFRILNANPRGDSHVMPTVSRVVRHPGRCFRASDIVSWKYFFRPRKIPMTSSPTTSLSGRALAHPPASKRTTRLPSRDARACDAAHLILPCWCVCPGRARRVPRTHVVVAQCRHPFQRRAEAEADVIQHPGLRRAATVFAHLTLRDDIRGHRTHGGNTSAQARLAGARREPRHRVRDGASTSGDAGCRVARPPERGERTRRGDVS